MNQVVDLILQNIARVQGTPKDINVDWFRRSKELIVVADAMENETPAAQAASAAMDELTAWATPGTISLPIKLSRCRYRRCRTSLGGGCASAW